MGATPVYALPYQGINDSPNGPDLGQDLAEAIEAVILARVAEIAALQAEVSFGEGGTYPTDVENASGTSAAGGFSNSLTGGVACAVTFVAPLSGTVDIHNSCQTGNSGAFVSICSHEVRAGAVVGSGTVVQAAAIENGVYSTGVHRATAVTPVSGLTPGATYNVQQLFVNTGGTGTFVNKRLSIRPAA